MAITRKMGEARWVCGGVRDEARVTVMINTSSVMLYLNISP